MESKIPQSSRRFLVFYRLIRCWKLRYDSATICSKLSVVDVYLNWGSKKKIRLDTFNSNAYVTQIMKKRRSTFLSKTGEIIEYNLAFRFFRYQIVLVFWLYFRADDIPSFYYNICCQFRRHFTYLVSKYLDVLNTAEMYSFTEMNWTNI